jgi:glycosyltransferase involved in cell wall biosynthesis
MVNARRDRPRIVVVTPVKDEAWVLDTFLSATTSWADEVIIADQQSTDGSVDIAKRYDRVRVVENDSQEYDEGYRQRLLLREARKVPGPRVIFALDADEVLSANVLDSDFLDRVGRLPPGSGIRMRWPHLFPGLERAFVPPKFTSFGFVDDGSNHTGHKLHSTRLPVRQGAPQLTTEELVVLHLTTLAWERTMAKLRWYQCWERLNLPEKRAVQLYRQYHPFDGANIHPVNRDWFKAYAQRDIRIPNQFLASAARLEEAVLAWILKHGPRHFAKLDIWNVDWFENARELGRDVPRPAVADPRRASERAIMAWLSRTQDRSLEPHIRWAQRSLRLLGW